MSDFVLIVDERQEVIGTVKEAVQRASVKVIAAADYPSAKRKLVQAVPTLILGHLCEGDYLFAGITFLQDLKQHPQLSKVPVILIAEELTDEIIQLASKNGAQGLLPWPAPAALVRHRLAAVLPSLVDEDEPRQEIASAESEIGSSATREDKLKLAQLLLAKALHGIKTSDLLDIVELDEVPRIVSEITRSVCGVAMQGGQTDGRVDKAETAAEDKGTCIELETVFKLT